MTSKDKRQKVGTKKSKNNETTEDDPFEQESQFILRLPMEYASTVRSIAQSTSAKDRLTIKIHPDGRHGVVRVDHVPLACKLMDLPCLVESLKTVDNNTFYKTANVSQMLVCTRDGDLTSPTESAKKSKTKDKDADKSFIWNQGITRPLKNARKRRFRKMAKKKYVESPDVEKQVKRLLSADAEATSVRWEVIATDESKEKTDQRGSLDNLDPSPGNSGLKPDHSSMTRREKLRELFDDSSSSSTSEEEDGEGQWQRTST